VDPIFEGAAKDRRFGAAEIESRLIDGLLRERSAWSAEALDRGAIRLRAGQPTMANLRNLALRLEGGDLSAIEAWLRGCWSARGSRVSTPRCAPICAVAILNEKC
jgi:hypothetical protein